MVAMDLLAWVNFCLILLCLCLSVSILLRRHSSEKRVIANTQKLFDEITPVMSEHVLKELSLTKHDMKLALEKVDQDRLNNRSEYMRIQRWIQEVKGEHKGGKNSKGVLSSAPRNEDVEQQAAHRFEAQSRKG